MSKNVNHDHSLVLAIVGVGVISFNVPLAGMVDWYIPLHILVRMGVASAMLAILLRAAPSIRDFRNVHEVAATLLCALASPLYVAAVVLASPTVAIVLLTTASLWAALFNRIVYRTNVSASFWYRQLLALVGLAIFGVGALQHVTLSSVFVGTLSGAVYGIFLCEHQRRPKGRPPTDMIVGTFLSAVPFAVVLLWTGLEGSDLSDLRSWSAAMAGGAAVGTAYVIISKALEGLPSHVVSMINGAQSPLGILWTVLFLGIVPTSNETIGAAIVLSAVLWQAWASRERIETRIEREPALRRIGT